MYICIYIYVLIHRYKQKYNSYIIRSVLCSRQVDSTIKCCQPGRDRTFKTIIYQITVTQQIVSSSSCFEHFSTQQRFFSRTFLDNSGVCVVVCSQCVICGARMRFKYFKEYTNMPLVMILILYIFIFHNAYG